MKNMQNEIFTDENGERWKTLSENPCERKLEPRKISFKISFDVEYELDLTVTQKEHTHIIREKEKCKYISQMEKYLFGDIKDFGHSDCLKMRATTQAKANIRQKDKTINKDEFALEYKALDFEFYSRNVWIFRDEIEYIEKHLPEQLEAVFKRLWKESTAHYSVDRDGAIKNLIDKNLIDKEEKSLRKRIAKVKRIDQKEYRKFVGRIKKVTQILLHENKPLNRTNVAEKFAEEYGESSNPLQKLRRKLKNFKITFEDLLDEVNT